MVAVGGTRAGMAWGNRRSSPPSPEGAAKAGWKRHLWAIINNIFSELCRTWSPSNVQKVICSRWLLHLSNNSLVSQKERRATHWRDFSWTRPSSIFSLEPSFLRPSGPLIHAQHLRTEWNLCIHYNMRCTIRETTSLGNLFQPLFWDKIAWLWWLYRVMATFGFSS